PLLLPARRAQPLGLIVEKRLSVLGDGVASSIKLGLLILDLLAAFVRARIGTLANRVTRFGPADARHAQRHIRISAYRQLGGLAAARPPVARNPSFRAARKDGEP